MHANRFKLGFTLIEVNLAIFLMGTGVVTICALFAMGFRENRQSVEDVAASAYADAYFAPFVQALSATNLTWQAWTSIGDSVAGAEGSADGIWPRGGWGAYVENFQPGAGKNAKDRDTDIEYRIVKNCRGVSDGIASQLSRALPNCGSPASLPSEYHYGFVVTRRGAAIQMALRIARRRDTMLAQGVYAVEVRYQGDPDRTTGGGR